MSNLETVRTMLACFSAGDPQGQLDRCTDDVVYEAPYYGLERIGKPELAAMLTAVQERFDSLASGADVLLESYAPGTTASLGIDFDTLRAANRRLVYCSITAYGDDGRHADRPGYDALVAARTGHQWESRGVPGGTLARLAGTAPRSPISSSPTIAGWRHRARVHSSPACRG